MYDDDKGGSLLGWQMMRDVEMGWTMEQNNIIFDCKL